MNFKKIALQLIVSLSFVFALGSTARAQADPIEGVWLNEEKDAKIKIYKDQDNLFYGRIIWLKEANENGAPKLDKNSPEKSLRTQPIIGKIILKKFKKDGKTYDDGTIYDPTNGKTYDATITYKGTTLALRGYVGISLFGRTTVWTKTN